VRVLNVNMSLDPVTGGGTAERTVQLTRALARAGAECELLVTDLGRTRARAAELPEARVVALPCLVERFYVPRCLPGRVGEAVRRADVVHLISHWTLLNLLAGWYARRLGKPYVVCPSGALPRFGRSQAKKRLYNALGGSRLVRQASGHVAITADERAHFRAYGVDPAAVTVIPNGIDEADLRDQAGAAGFRHRLGLGPDPFVLFVGRLNAIKGPDLLLRAFCAVRDRLPGHHLVLAGPDEGMGEQLDRLAREHGGAGRVHFTGHLDGPSKAAAYHAADLLAVPSRQEAMSIVALEAGATGTPVLLTDRCGFAEVAGAGGGLVVPATVDGLARGLLDLLLHGTDLGAMGARLRRLVLARYTWDRAAAGYLALYRDLLAAGAGERRPGPARRALSGGGARPGR
jgi:glycosyltransferase involved in cell wall biosynthesis